MISVLIILGMIGAVALILALYLVFTREPEDEYPDVPADPDGTATSAWLRSCAADPDRPVAGMRELHHEPAFAMSAAGMLEMLPPDPPPAATAPLPKVVCEFGMPADNEKYIDELFAAAERAIGVLAEHAGGGAAGSVAA